MEGRTRAEELNGPLAALSETPIQPLDVILFRGVDAVSRGKVARSAFRGPRPPHHVLREHMHALHDEFGHTPYTRAMFLGASVLDDVSPGDTRARRPPEIARVSPAAG